MSTSKDEIVNVNVKYCARFGLKFIDKQKGLPVM